MYFIIVEMRKVADMKKFILLIIAVVIVVGGFYFDVQETHELYDNMGYSLTAYSDDFGAPLHSAISIKSATAIIAVVAEIKDAGIIREALKRFENRSSSKRILIITLIIFLCLSFGRFFLNVLPSVFPWTDIISSRRSIISYIHLQDGEK